MTYLETLSMSGNKLEDKIFFGEGYTLGHLPNLTILELDGNKFTKLPVEQIVLHDRLKRLSIENNQITKYSPELTEMVKLGLDVEYAGNYPL